MKSRTRRSVVGGRRDPPAPAPDSGMLRMRDLIRESGLPRETIHFYLAQGLLPPPHKTGRNTALYDKEHLERLRGIRELRERQFLPLKAIKAILDGNARPGFTREQEAVLRSVRLGLGRWARPEAVRRISLQEAAASRVSREEIESLRSAGLIDIHGSGRTATVSEEDAVVIETWARLRDIGFGPERGFKPSDLAPYSSAVETAVREVVPRVAAGFSKASADEASLAIERALPITNTLLAALLRKHTREVLAGL